MNSVTQCLKPTIIPRALFDATHYPSWPIASQTPNKCEDNHTPERFLKILSSPSVEIRTATIFNNPETRVFYAAKNALRDAELQNWHVHGQVSYGRIFKSSASEDYIKTVGFDPHRAFNSKSADVVITDNEGRPALVIEYQGSGHDAKNDAVKEQVCKKANVALLPVYPEPVTPAQPLKDYVDICAVKRAILREIGFHRYVGQMH